MKFVVVFVLLALSVARCELLTPTDSASINIDQARQYFQEIKTISDRDAGQLWGISLYGPTLFVDPNTRFIVANQMDRDGKLSANREVYTGTLEPKVNIANTSVFWADTMWTMVDWNAVSATDPYDRARLLIHESWHRVQEKLGIPSATTANFYLDDADGRSELFLEFRALSRALLSDEASAQKEAIIDALTFRHYRQSRHTENNENAFERHEGMAEYTGLKLCGIPDFLLAKVVSRRLQLGESNDGLANSFAYLTGPALGLLLDRHSPHWRDSLRLGNDLPTLLASAISWRAPAGVDELLLAADRAGKSYGAAELIARESTRSQAQENTVASFRNRLLMHGRLLIPNNNLNFSFDPMERLITFDSTGVIYKTMRITGNFGILEVTDGILRTNDWQYFVAVAPDQFAGDFVEWQGYTLQLRSGWLIKPQGKGTLVITRN